MIKYIILGILFLTLTAALSYAGEVMIKQTRQIAQLELTLETQNEAIEKAKEAYAKAQEDLAELRTDYNEAEKSRSGLEELLARHDLEKLAKAKPAIIERLINRATAEKLQHFREFGQ